MMTDHLALRPIPTDVPQDISAPDAVLTCFRVVWNNHTRWQVDVWAACPDDAIKAVMSALDMESFSLIGVIDLQTSR